MFTENKTTEFKREYIDDIKNTIVAFANCDGGTLYIGVNDDGTVRGVNNVDDTMLRVTNAVRNAVRPDITMFVECHNDVMDDKPIVYVTVQRGTARPYYLQGKGIRPEGVYVRQGASTVPATEAAILNMIKETSGDSYETARSLNQHLTFNKAADFFKKRKVEFGKTQMRTLHLIGEDDMYTNLAFLLSDQCTHMIKLAVFEGSRKTIFKDRRELSGSLLEQLEEAFDYIDRYNRTRAEFAGLDRLDMRDYPPEAIREALLNSIVHRDYSFSSATLISIFEDRIEFVTIGGLVKGITLDDIKLGVSVLRNQHLANIFYRLRLIEAYGTGILKINECYDDYAVKPMIETTNNAFKITLPNTNFHAEDKDLDTPKTDSFTSVAKKEERMNAVLKLCRSKGSIVRSDVEMALGVSQSTAILLLRELTDGGILIKKGKTKNLRYYENKGC
ncbi:putative DNA binding domain-containing protein [Faecalicatena orotica]|uniref:ATP-dependent DNA helicase RecG n=1 Tax=Faecalicatena orotica TaxID=1544 RepID=A0A2Y9BBQ0_9FIRM|nr:RNA-binding domain-containing protein [Faecalicatena orotica]PWJ30328.1 ATP-dependent DNA helicase RecG [Faecalicatena orotica]SSA55319.1 ATP-dependent DNA helicase RecG [Faecalicatena orotica]